MLCHRKTLWINSGSPVKNTKRDASKRMREMGKQARPDQPDSPRVHLGYFYVKNSADIINTNQSCIDSSSCWSGLSPHRQCPLAAGLQSHWVIGLSRGPSGQVLLGQECQGADPVRAVVDTFNVFKRLTARV